MDKLNGRERRRVSSLGGKARAQKLSPEERTRIAREAAGKRWRARWSAEASEIVSLAREHGDWYLSLDGESRKNMEKTVSAIELAFMCGWMKAKEAAKATGDRH